jgi:carboxylesterase
VAVVVLSVVVGAFVPWQVVAYSSRPDPATSYADAVQRAQSFDLDGGSKMNPVCRTQLMTHGDKTERAIVLVHGYTSCPAQFHDLGQLFFDSGYNVLIAPMPHHGLADRLTDEISLLTADELGAYADRVIDIARGLGDRVDMAGISAGGVVTSWAAQNRNDIDLAVLISPGFGFKVIPTALTAPEINIASVMPESFTWWDPVLQMNTQPPYAYPRYSMHALTQIVGLGFSVQMAAHRQRPRAGSILVVTSGNEPSVNNVLTGEVAANWRAHGAVIATYEFPADLKLPHDLIDPNQDDARTDLVYPQLIQLIKQYR